MFLNESRAFTFLENEVPIFTICFEVEQGVPSFDNEVFLAPAPSATAIMG